MLWLLMLAWFAPGQAPARHAPIDVGILQPGAPTIVTEIDLGKLKGDPRRLAWSPDMSEFYLQTAEGKPPSEKLRHYLIPFAGGTARPVDQEPEWATRYWAWKQDRVAPGDPGLVIEIKQTVENIKQGTGAAGVLDRSSSPDAVGANNPSIENLANGQHGNQTANVVRLMLLGEEIAKWMNERPIPGTRFGWGPHGSAALVHLNEDGSMTLFDQLKHRQPVPGVKDALLPAWSPDGDRLAYLRKTARKKYELAWLPLLR